ncbi:MAG: enoyl-CoA hydratase/isomerase family protein [Rhodospirillales bacterium]|jgi:enoyl-CoA hydratase/carnithine racemase|nr:enoyl-CoA hydratase [Rhodospirillaceae bacterium]MDP6429098.1 enoyl-CoA hydratase/isomerase family protein [Rhodospirillales bacterium]MDP6645775.1 enoyl-CoA hydratase/isomerase family protein [Rhodospirillales bacterium]MDP6843491.1 enoyl-CoA hydratase/isomerase family protein [Rhodospirillales bacterium]|tara:strand:- start:2428 stop:3192 length:765 start_codon:yes stop_codon:yes gene_type:complete
MIELEKSGPIAVVGLCRPPVNAINQEWMARMGEILADLEADQGISLVRIRSLQKVFCGGFDIGLIRHHLESGGGPDAQISDTKDLQTLYFRLENLPQVTVAEINGAAMGGGLELALCCDLRVAADEAIMGLPEVTLGQVPGAGGTQRLSRICGKGVASRIILARDNVDGAKAEELGIVQWALPGAELAAWTDALVDRIAGFSAATLASSKACIAAEADPGIDGFALEMAKNRLLLETEETQELVAAFFQRGRDA